jgi:hypothetical protein
MKCLTCVPRQSFPAVSAPSVITLVKQNYCREHFIQTSY